jgi:hypothetical protein
VIFHQRELLARLAADFAAGTLSFDAKARALTLSSFKMSRHKNKVVA